MIHYTTHVIAWAALIGAALVCLIRGDVPEKVGFVLIAANWIATPLVEIRHSWLELQPGIILANVVLVLALSAIALRTRRLWPIPAAGLELIGVLVRIAPLLDARAFLRAAPYADSVVGYLVLGCVIGGSLVEGKYRSIGSAPRSDAGHAAE